MRIPLYLYLVGDYRASMEKIQMTLAQIERGLPPTLEKELLEAAHFMRGQAQARVRVDTGSLQKSIRVEHISGLAVRVRAGGYVINPKTGKIVDYATYQERYHPYMKPAWEETKNFVKGRVRVALGVLAHA